MKTILLPIFRQHFSQYPYLAPAFQTALCCHLEVRYLPRGENLYLGHSSIGFLATGLLKEYVRGARYRPTFMQFIDEGDCFVYLPEHYHHTYKALEPSWVLHLDLGALVTICTGERQVAHWLDEVQINHELRHALPFFLRELSDREQRIEIFLSEFGHAVTYLSMDEVCTYLHIGKARCRAFFHHLL